MQFPKSCSEFWFCALCNSPPKLSKTTGKTHKTQPQKLLWTWSMLCTARTDVGEVSHAFLSLLYCEKRQAEAEHELGSGAVRNIPNHVLGCEHQKKRAGTWSFSKTWRGSEEMRTWRSGLSKKCADHLIAIIEASMFFQILYVVGHNKNHHQMHNQRYRNLSASGVHESASICMLVAVLLFHSSPGGHG
jgi:hypothetical protein